MFMRILSRDCWKSRPAYPPQLVVELRARAAEFGRHARRGQRLAVVLRDVQHDSPAEGARLRLLAAPRALYAVVDEEDDYLPERRDLYHRADLADGVVLGLELAEQALDYLLLLLAHLHDGPRLHDGPGRQGRQRLRDEVGRERVVVRAQREAERAAEGGLYRIGVVGLQPAEAAVGEGELDPVDGYHALARGDEEHQALVLGYGRRGLGYGEVLQLQELVAAHKYAAHGLNRYALGNRPILHLRHPDW